MAELEDRLNAVLSDPEQMGRIAQMASRLMGSISTPAPEPQNQSSGMDPALMGMVGRIMGGLRNNGSKQQLIQGLSPYLAPKRQQRLEKALRLATAAKLAGAAFAEMGGGES